MILLNLAKRIGYIGNTITIYLSEEDNKLYTDLFVDETFGKESLFIQFNESFNILIELKLLKHVESLGDDQNTYTLTTKGWSKIQELQKEILKSSQAFIAMCFNPDLNEARQAITRAISDCGYIPIIIDDKEHNNQIVPEIFYEIKQSHFIVADLTKQRNGVYYEAGYAEALNKEVILTCKKEDFETRHFDIAQKNTIEWISPDDLYTRLVKRIRATVGEKI